MPQTPTSLIPPAGTLAEADADSYRMAMRELASGVAVVTVGKDGEITGFTATSVSSLCTRPPRLLVCVAQNSAAAPVSFYAGVFVSVNATYLLLCMEVIDRPQSNDLPAHARRMMRVRSFVTLGLFALAAAVALKYPIGGMALICLCLIVYLRPEAP